MDLSLGLGMLGPMKVETYHAERQHVPTRPGNRGLSAWAGPAYFAAVGVATAVYFFLPIDAQSMAYNGIAVSAAVAMIVGARWRRPEPQAAWLLLGLGVLALACGDIVFGSTQPVPSPADMFYISAVPLLGLGLWGLTASRWMKRGVPAVLIAIAIASSVVVLSWVFLVLPAGERGQVTFATRLVAIGYPVTDLALIGALSFAAASTRWQDARYRYLGGGLVMKFAADIAYAVQDLGMGYQVGNGIDAFWLVSYGLLGAALLHPPSPTNGSWENDEAVRPDLARAEMEPEAAPPRKTKRAVSTLATAQVAVQFAFIVLWAGRLLLAFATVAMFAGAAWMSAQMVMLAGAFGTGGILMWAAGSIATASPAAVAASRR